MKSPLRRIKAVHATYPGTVHSFHVSSSLAVAKMGFLG